MEKLTISEMLELEITLADKIAAAVESIRATGRVAKYVPETLRRHNDLYLIDVEMRFTPRHKATRCPVLLLT